MSEIWDVAGGDEYRLRLESALSDQYELHEVVGAGAMGIVYRAFDRRLKRPVAVKLLPPELTFRTAIKTRFLREAETAARLSHANIVPIHSIDERNGLVFITMGFVDGLNLGAEIAGQGRLHHAAARRVLAEVADALAYAHEQGVVHRDIKPDNILIDGATRKSMVTDFGIARAISNTDTRLTATGVAIGTPAYMSPEQCTGELEVSGRSDLYSLGAVGYHMLAGRPPFEAPSTPAMLIKQYSEIPLDLRELRLDVPDDLAAIIMRMLEKNPRDRFETGRDVVAALHGEIQLEPAARFAERQRERQWDRQWERRDQVPAAAPARGGTVDASTVEDAGRDSSDANAKDEQASAIEESLDWLLMRDVEHAGGARARRPTLAELRRGMHHNSQGRTRFSELPLSDRIRTTRSACYRALAFGVFFFFINMSTYPAFPWFIFPTVGIGMKALRRVLLLSAQGISLGTILGNAAIAPREEDAQGTAPHTANRRRPLAESPRSARYGPILARAASDRSRIDDQVRKLSPADRQLIPDALPTANALYSRVVSLCEALQNVETHLHPGALAEVEARIASAEGEHDVGRPDDRKLALLTRQRETIQRLIQARESMDAQLESAVIMLQNLALDTVRLRSAGIQSVMSDLNGTTQEARALMREIEYVLGAAEDVRGM